MAVSPEKPKTESGASLDKIVRSIRRQSSEHVVNPRIKQEDHKEILKGLGSSCIDAFKEAGITVKSRTAGEYWVVGKLPPEGGQDG